MADLDIEEDTTVSLQDVLEEDKDLEDTANAVLGDSDDTKCSYSKGYVGRQALYACGTCVSSDSKPAGICLACSLQCHEGHDLYELYTKRDFRCDCGNSKFPTFTCTLHPDKEETNLDNRYNHNFRGLYCSCNRPYPDIEDEVEDEMIQCIICEDWFHSRHLQGDTPPSYEEMVCGSCMGSCDFLWHYQLHTAPMRVDGSSDTSSVEVTKERRDGNGIDTDTSTGTSTSIGAGGSCELARRKAVLNQTASSSDRKVAAGFLDNNWRSQLCTCSVCMEMYKSHNCLFLLEDSDSLSAYEKRAQTYPDSHTAAVAALDTIDHVHQVEALHHYRELKTELSDFLTQFAQKRKVVSEKDIQGFFEEMQSKKKRRLETGDGIPPANCR